MKVEQYILLYFIIVNIVGFVMMGIDKYKAKKHKWRIPEATLFFIAVIGGSIGSIIGMYVFRHKTKHLSFKLGMPIILVVQILIVIVIFLSPVNIIFL